MSLKLTVHKIKGGYEAILQDSKSYGPYAIGRSKEAALRKLVLQLTENLAACHKKLSRYRELARLLRSEQ